ncbi:MAG: hypothetical protein WCQ70_09885 [Lentimicrobiaceae bacterium]
MEEVKSFIGQRMNLDVDEKLLKPEETREFYNALADISGTVLKFKGTTKVNYTLPVGTNKVLYSCKDHARNAVIYFVYNSNGYHCILRYRASKIDRILWTCPPLNFKLEKPINHGFVIGDLLFWTDGYDVGFETLQNNPPREINFIKALGTNNPYVSGTYSEFDVVSLNGKVYEYISKTPSSEPVTNDLYWKLKGRTYQMATHNELYRIMDRIKYPMTAEVPTVKYKNT